MNRPEDKIQYTIVRWLQAEGYWFYSVPNEGGGGNVARLTRLISLGLRKGAADLVVCLYGAVGVYLECKDPLKGRQSQEQKLFQSKMEERGFEYHLVYSLEDAQKVLKGRR